jgi:hypothetical protein
VGLALEEPRRATEARKRGRLPAEALEERARVDGAVRAGGRAGVRGDGLQPSVGRPREREGFPQHHAEGVEIGPRARARSIEQLGRHVPRGSARQGRNLVEERRQAEIDQHRASVCAHHHVRGLHVPVTKACVVKEDEPLERVGHRVGDGAGRPTGRPRVQRRPFHERRHEVREALSLDGMPPEPVHLDDARVPQAAQACQLGGELRAGPDLQLHGHASAHRFVQRDPRLARRAAAQRSLEPVAMPEDQAVSRDLFQTVRSPVEVEQTSTAVREKRLDDAEKNFTGSTSHRSRLARRLTRLGAPRSRHSAC